MWLVWKYLSSHNPSIYPLWDRSKRLGSEEVEGVEEEDK
jgi:hypothetical protein